MQVKLLKQNIDQLMYARDVIPDAQGQGILPNLHNLIKHVLHFG